MVAEPMLLASCLAHLSVANLTVGEGTFPGSRQDKRGFILNSRKTEKAEPPPQARPAQLEAVVNRQRGYLAGPSKKPRPNQRAG